MMREILVGAIGAVVAALIVAAAEASFGALSLLLGPSVPPGAVVAFEAGKCPDGWKLYHDGAGRFLFGADKDHDLRSEGGKEKHMLTWDEMPKHRHDDDKGKFLLVKKSYNITATDVDDKGRDEINIRHGVRMNISGNNAPHENMPPYRVVNFCEKK